MAYVNTGQARCLTFEIDKKVAGSSLPGYPREYSIISAFTSSLGSFSAISETDFRRLSVTSYLSRLSAFKAYVQVAESVGSVDSITLPGYEAYKTDVTMCPIGR